MSATRAQNEFGRLLDRAIGGQHVVITRHNRPAAVLVSAEDYEGSSGVVRPLDQALDPDVAIRLKKLCEGRGESRTSIVNDLLRRGLDALHRRPEERPRYSIEPHDPGRCYVRDLDNAQDALAFGEGEAYR